jgi:hypothetical protein
VVTKLVLDETLLGEEEGWPRSPGPEEVTMTLADGWPILLGGGSRLPLLGYHGCQRETRRWRPVPRGAHAEEDSVPLSNETYMDGLRESELRESKEKATPTCPATDT